MITRLENKFISVGIKSKGAEMCSLLLKEDGTEYLWQGDPKYWAWHAPICFPIVGILANGEYQIEDKNFALTVHGFARDMEFTLVESHTDKALYRLSYDQETLINFPYKFQLEIEYTLLEYEVSVEYKVKNLEDQPMYFSIGAHTGFNCPLTPHDKWEDYELIFEENETAKRHFVEKGLISGVTEVVLKESSIIPLTEDIFKKDVFIFKNLKSQSIALKSKKTSRCVRVSFVGFPYLGIWSKLDGAPFICIEPWYGITDHSGESRKISQKEGIQTLMGGKEFACCYKIGIG